MEAVPRLPMISFDLKISPESTSFGPKLKQYIRDVYHEDPEMYSNEIHNLEGLRATAVCAVRDVTGCSALKRYYCQLHFLQSRFPMAKDGAAAVPFTWRDTYASMVCTLADIRFEMVSILYNIGALHSQLGASDSRVTADGMKLSCTHFQCAAWAFQHLKDTFPQPAGVDLAPDVMQYMYHLSLAQAQECILEKSMMDNRKATIIAKVAVQIVDYYNLALNTLEQAVSDDCSVAETVGSKLYKNWKRYVKFKIAYHTCVSLLYQGQQSEEQQKMGERVAYYQAASEKLEESIKLSKGMDKVEAVNEALAFTMDVVEGKKKAAKNENEFIYHEEVPDKDTLPDVKGASLVKGIPFNVNDTEVSGPDIFARLVPMKAHEASSLYSEEKAKLLRRVGVMMDEKDQELVTFMTSLQLDHLNLHSQPDKLPQEVVECCAALSAKPNAIQNLIDAMNKLADTYHDVEGMLQDIKEMLELEESREKEYQEVMGKRPPSIVATDLTREANKYQEAHSKASESNQTLHKAMTLHIANLRILSQPLPELQKQIPTISTLNSPGNESSVKEMQHLVNKVEEMRRQRAMLASQLRESTCQDDITRQLVTRAGESLDTIFSQEMQKHERYVVFIEQNLAAQGNILKALTEAYAEYADTRKATNDIVRRRDSTVASLVLSYGAYEDLLAKSSKGLEFYRKLETNVGKLLQRVRGTCKVQEEEREQILSRNNKVVPTVVDPAPITSGPKLKDYLQSMKGNQTSTYFNTAGYQAPYPAQGSTDATQQWVPAVRPAPVGSEGTEQTPSVCSVPSKQDVEEKKSSQLDGKTYPGYYPQYAYPYNYQQGYQSDSQYATPQGSQYSTPTHQQQYTPQSSQYSTPTHQGGSYVTPSLQQVSSSQSNSQLPLQPSNSQYNVQAPQVSTSQYDLSTQLPQASNTQYSVAPSEYNSHVSQAGSTHHPTTSPQYNVQTSQAGSTQYPTASPQYNAQTPQAGSIQYPITTPQYNVQTPQAGSTQYPTTTPQYNVQTPQAGSTQYPTTTPQYNVQTPQAGSTQYPTQSTPHYNTQVPQAGGIQYPTQETPQHITQTSQAQYPQYSSQNSAQTPQPTASQYNVQYPYGTQYATLPYSTPALGYQPQTRSYSGHPGYGYDTASGSYQYSSGYQSSGGYNLQQGSPTLYCGTQSTNQQTTGIQSTNQHTSTHLANQGNANQFLNTQLNNQHASTTQVSNQEKTNKYTGTQLSNQQAAGIQSTIQGGSGTQLSNQADVNQYSSTPQQTNEVGTSQYYGAHPTNLQAIVPQLNNQAIGNQYSSSQLVTQQAAGTQMPNQVQYYNSQQAVWVQYPANQGQLASEASSSYQYMTGTGVSSYTSAGKPATLQTCSSQTSVEGQTYASQYDATQGLYQAPVYSPGAYYSIPYGYQCDNTPPQSPSHVVSTPQTAQQDQQQNNSTYIQARGNTTTTTYSQQGGSGVSSTGSNVDLLAGLDFSLNQAPLVPQSPAKSAPPVPAKVAPVAVATVKAEPEVEVAVTEPAVDPATSEAHSSETPELNQSSNLSKLVIPKSEGNQDDSKAVQKSFGKDPYTDPEALNPFVLEVEKYEKFVEGLTTKTLNGPTPLDMKWKELLELQEKDATKPSISVARCYPMKNRFPDILPYDNSRVELPSTKDDYINASYMKDLTPLTPSFIVTQAPLPLTYVDFWTMVWEQQVEVIICLLSDAELEGQVYWPTNKGQDLGFGRMRLTLQSCNVRQHCIERIMSLCVVETRVTRVIVHLQFTAWPGSSFPASPGPFLGFVSEALNYHQQQRGASHPLVVHCLSGVGRTGLFCLVMAAMCEIQAGRGLVDLVVTTAAMSMRRKGSLRDREHLKFAYQAVLYYAQDLLMKRGILTSRSTFEDKRGRGGKSHTRHPSEDFLLGPPTDLSALQSGIEKMGINNKQPQQ